MNKTTKTTMQFILGGILFVTFAVAGCNDSKTDKTTTTDTIITPVAPDTTMDTGGVRPTPGGN